MKIFNNSEEKLVVIGALVYGLLVFLMWYSGNEIWGLALLPYPIFFILWMLTSDYF